MKAIASFVMRGRMQATVAVVGFAALSLVMPIFGYLGIACVALVTLREGTSSGLMLVIASSVLLVGATMASSNPGYIILIVGSLLILSVAMLLLGSVLRITKSLMLAMLTAAALGVLAVIVMHLAVEDTTVWWHAKLTEMFSEAIKQSPADGQEALFETIKLWAPQMTGILAAVLALNGIICLFLARWWQALLYNPGGFQQEFYKLRFAKNVAFATALLAILSMLNVGIISTIANDLLTIALMVYVIQGIAVAHAILAMKKLPTAWFFGLYIAVLFMSQIIAMIGFIDTWVNFRNKVAQSSATK